MTRLKIALGAICLLLISGCGTLVTLNLDVDKKTEDHPYREKTYAFVNLHHECDDPNEFISFPYVYSGVKYDIMYITRPFDCGLDTGEVAMINNFIYLLIYPFAIVDIPLSLIVDTALLHKTIKQQNSYGNMLDPPYFKMANNECRKNDDKCLKYYKKGFALLPKYFGDAPLSEINIYLDIDEAFYEMSGAYERRGDYLLAAKAFEQHILLETKKYSEKKIDQWKYDRLLGLYARSGQPEQMDPVVRALAPPVTKRQQPERHPGVIIIMDDNIIIGE